MSMSTRNKGAAKGSVAGKKAAPAKKAAQVLPVREAEVPMDVEPEARAEVVPEVEAEIVAPPKVGARVPLIPSAIPAFRAPAAMAAPVSNVVAPLQKDANEVEDARLIEVARRTAKAGVLPGIVDKVDKGAFVDLVELMPVDWAALTAGEDAAKVVRAPITSFEELEQALRVFAWLHPQVPGFAYAGVVLGVARSMRCVAAAVAYDRVFRHMASPAERARWFGVDDYVREGGILQSRWLSLLAVARPGASR
jgi:hypothetical protein